MDMFKFQKAFYTSLFSDKRFSHNYLQAQKNIFKASIVHHLKPFLNKAKADAYFNSNVVALVNHSFEMGNAVMKKLS